MKTEKSNICEVLATFFFTGCQGCGTRHVNESLPAPIEFTFSGEKPKINARTYK